MTDWGSTIVGGLTRLGLWLLILGVARHAALTILETARREEHTAGVGIGWLRWQAGRWLGPFDLVAAHPIYSLTLMVWHLLIVAIPLTLTTHLALIEGWIGIGWAGIPHALSDGMTLAAIALCPVLFVARLAHPGLHARGHAERAWWYAVILLVFASGHLTAHPELNPIGYATMMTLHRLSGMALLAAIPFTSLAHTIGLTAVRRLPAEAEPHVPLIRHAAPPAGIAPVREEEP